MSPEIVVHVVDDDAAVRNSLAFLLATSGFAVRTHDSASAFLEIAPSIRNGCLITDLRMPDMSGLELLQRLRAIDAMLPAIVVTGHGDVHMAVEAMKAGALDFIEKPYSDDMLLAAIQRAASKAEDGAEETRRNEAVAERLAQLSERERQVLAGVAAGLSNKAVALSLGISPRTVEVHRASLMGKMGAKTLPDLVRMTVGIDLGAGTER